MNTRRVACLRSRLIVVFFNIQRRGERFQVCLGKEKVILKEEGRGEERRGKERKECLCINLPIVYTMKINEQWCTQIYLDPIIVNINFLNQPWIN